MRLHLYSIALGVWIGCYGPVFGAETRYDGFYIGAIRAIHCFDAEAEGRLHIVNGKARLVLTNGTSGDFWFYPPGNIQPDGSLDLSPIFAKLEGRIRDNVFEASLNGAGAYCKWHIKLERKDIPLQLKDTRAQPASQVCETVLKSERFTSQGRMSMSNDNGWCTTRAVFNLFWPWDKIEISMNPQHGELRVRNGPISNFIDYKPKAGYIGKDRIEFRATKTNKTTWDYSYDLEISR